MWLSTAFMRSRVKTHWSVTHHTKVRKYMGTHRHGSMKLLICIVLTVQIITIYAPMIYTAQCIMFWMRAYPLRGKVGGGWSLEFESFWALWNSIEPIGECHLGPKKPRIPGPNPLPLAKVMDMHTSIGFMHKIPRGRFQGPYLGGWRSRCIKELVCPARPAPPHYKTY